MSITELSDKVFDKVEYRSIVFLTLVFGEKEGLRHQDYVYALVRKKNKIPTDIKAKWKKELNQNNVSAFVSLIQLDCITTPSNLSEKLKKLVNDYKLLEKDTFYNIPYYKVKKDRKNLALKWFFIKVIEKCPDNYIEKLANKFFEGYHEIVNNNNEFLDLLDINWVDSKAYK